MSEFSFCLNEGHYDQALAAFHSNTNQRELGMNWMKSKMPDIIAKAASTQPFRVLAVGTGDGIPFDEGLVEILCTSQKHVVYTVVEPLHAAVEAFQDLVKYKCSSVEFQWFCMSWEEFQDKEWKKDGSRYNLIHFIHSVYYITSSVEELTQRIRKCFDQLLNPGGAMVFFAANCKGKNCFMTSNERFWWGVEYNLILKISSDEGWKVDADELCSKVDLSSCFDEDSVEGNLVLDFLTRVTNFRQTASREEVDAMMKHLEQQTEGNSRIVYPIIFDITTIWKETSAN